MVPDKKYSAKRPILPSVFCHGPRQRRLQWAPPPVPVPRALVGTRQRRLLCRVSGGLALGKEPSSGPRCQYICRVPWQQHSAKMSLPVPRFASLPSAMVIALGKEVPLPSVTLGKVTRMSLFYLLLLFHPNKQKIYIIQITLYINHITE